MEDFQSIWKCFRDDLKTGLNEMMNAPFLTFLQQLWSILAMAAPYILFGFLVAGVIHTLISPAKIAKYLGKKNWKSVIMASICGIPLPLCSCSVLPTAAALRQKGASRGATASFLISTPETGVDSIAMTYGIMDLTMALLRPISALITALLAGFAVNVWGESEEPAVENSLKENSCCCCKSHQSSSDETVGKSMPTFSRPLLTEALHYAFVDLRNDLSHWLALGLILSALISACIPNWIFASWAGQGVSSLLLMLLIGTPMYICATGSTPIAAVMMAKGLSPGAALVFLLAGPATNIGSIPLLLKMIGKRSTVLYLVSIVLMTFLFGMGVNWYYGAHQIVPQMAIHTHEEHLGLIQWISGFVLLAMLILGMWKRPVPMEWRRLNEKFAGMTGWKITWNKTFVLAIVLVLLSCAVLFF